MGTEVQTVDFTAANAILLKIRKHLELGEEFGPSHGSGAYGTPSTVEDGELPAGNEPVSAAEEDEDSYGPDTQQDTAHGTGSPGEGGADNQSDVIDALNLYLDGIAQKLIDQYAMSDDDAYNFIFEVSDALTDQGQFPLFPEEDEAPDEDYAEWLGKAKSVNFAAQVLQAASDQSQ